MLALSSELGTLGGHLFVIAMVWIVVIVALQVIKISLLKSAATALDGEDDAEKRTQAQSKTRKSIAIASIAATAVAVIAALVFAVFQWNYNAPKEKQTITPAQVDDSKQLPSEEDIKKTNENSSDIKSSKAKEDDAKQDNTKAMNEAMKSFREAGNNATQGENKGDDK